VGFSGGKDGAYVLHRLVNHYRAKVLAVTVNQGLMSDQGFQCAAQLTKAMGVDHLVIEQDQAKQRAFLRKCLNSFGEICLGCTFLLYPALLKTCFEKRIPLLVHGRSPAQIFRGLDERSLKSDPVTILSNRDLLDRGEYDPEKLRAQYRKAFASLSVLLRLLAGGDEACARVATGILVSEEVLAQPFLPEPFAYYLIEPYDENAIRETLRRELGYEAPASHADCLVHSSARYFFANVHGASADVQETAAMLRLGLMPRQVAEAVIRSSQATPAGAPRDFSDLCGTLNVDEELLQDLLTKKRNGLRLIRNSG